MLKRLFAILRTFFKALLHLRPGKESKSASVFATHLGMGPAGAEKPTGFTLNKSELPNLIQFMAATNRTGKLSLEFLRSGKRGAVYFREGAITNIRYDNFQGKDGLARMINEGTAETSFVEDLFPLETNVVMDASGLILEAAVLADELASQEPAAAGVASAPTAKAGALLLDRQTERRVQELAVKVWRYGRFTAQLLLLAGVFALVFGGGYFACWKVWQVYNGAEDRKLKSWNEEQKQFLDDQRRKREESALSNGFRDVAQLKAEAETQFAKLAAVDKGQGVGEMTEGIEVALRLGQVLFEAKKYEEASRSYKNVMTQAPQVLALDRQRQQALAQQAEADRLRGKAEAVGAPALARLLWDRAQGLDAAAHERFQARDFVEAGLKWLAAATQDQKAEAYAVLARGMATAREGYEAELKTLDLAVLNQGGGSAWDEARRLAEEAAGGMREGDLAKAIDKWRAARVLARTAVAAAAKAQNSAEFRTRMATAQQLLARSQWQEAETLFTEAGALPGFAQEAGVTQGLTTARRERWLAEAEKFKTAETWEEVQRCAQEALAVDPYSLAAQTLIGRAKEGQLPQVQVRATGDGVALAAGRVILDKDVREGPFPQVCRVELGRTYALRVEVPVQGTVAFVPYTGTYSTRKRGRQELVVSLVRARAPDPGQMWTIPSLNHVMIPVAAGRFTMGSPAGRLDERPVHDAILSRPFWLAQTEVTNRHYRQFLKETHYDGNRDANNLFLLHLKRRSDISGDDDFPVCYVSWLNAAAFCTWLNRTELQGERLPKGYVYRLPTEAEWEYACRAGTDGDFAGEINNMAAYEHNSRATRGVAAWQANGWGLYDMHGNVWEWCLDWKGDYAGTEQKNPYGPATGVFKILRGGSWQSPKTLCRSATRHSASRYESDGTIGFRIALAPEIPDVWTVELPPTADGMR